eukprot:TRINITY_DN24167_c4_g1_i1.p2 TRINITY_DN24167_c4_g1~~TRINITY_DN24167_c4_g1_i1.p2  ORF type:complete len:494 (+),score=223.33 TRINITY_DN24167_c4_g1_i1:99-1484(+)
MDTDSSMESRLRYIEQLSQQLTRQMKAMKQLVSTEVQDLKQSLQQQADEMRQVLIQQDRLYQEQIRRLESRVEQLAEFAMHLAQSKSLAGTMGPRQGGDALSAITSSPRGAKSPEHPSGAALGGPTPPPLGAVRGAESEEDDFGDQEGGIPAVLDKYRPKIAAVYRHYAETASRALHPTMMLPQFTKFTKDCGLCNSSQGGTVAVHSSLPPPELLWMNVQRRLPQARRRRRGNAQPAGFAFERVQELTEEQFPDALVVLSEEKYRRDAEKGVDPAQLVEHFLTSDIFPVTDRRIQDAAQQRELERARRSTPLAATSINDYYDTKEVNDAFKEYRTKLRNSFQTYVAKYHTVYRRSDKLGLQGFSDLLRDHGLAPHIAARTVREIFLNVMQGHTVMSAARDSSPRAAARKDEELEIDMKGYYSALRHVAEHIYGDRALVEKFPTPEARLRKLLAKMYLLSHG